MQKYFVSKECYESKKIEKETAFQIIKVLRGKPKDQFLLGVDEKTYLAEITELTSKEVFFQILEEIKMESELPVQVDLFQGFPKGDKIENIIKYGTQLGLHSIFPVLMKRSIVKIDSSKRENKQIRYQKIAQESAEQSLRAHIPYVGAIDTLDHYDFDDYDVKLLCYEESAKEHESSQFKKAVKQLKKNSKIAVIVGPEGGIEPSEKEKLEQKGFVCVGLGPRILRTETVVFYVLSAISYEMELKA